mmetsp:Transcript_5007/g.14007  ORF Transcript_5007/g.14007 Transcript_5007/m.14007 type:complete len:227 (-) Transcript_5007:827-1507(-)
MPHSNEPKQFAAQHLLRWLDHRGQRPCWGCSITVVLSFPSVAVGTTTEGRGYPPSSRLASLVSNRRFLDPSQCHDGARQGGQRSHAGHNSPRSSHGRQQGGTTHLGQNRSGGTHQTQRRHGRRQTRRVVGVVICQNDTTGRPLDRPQEFHAGQTRGKRGGGLRGCRCQTRKRPRRHGNARHVQGHAAPTAQGLTNHAIDEFSQAAAQGNGGSGGRDKGGGYKRRSQ